MIAITGNTYPVREQLKALGARWNPDDKSWMVADAHAAKARAIVSSAPAQARPTGSTYRPSRCRVCGAEEKRDSRGYLTVRIYRSGECQDCFEERRMGY